MVDTIAQCMIVVLGVAAVNLAASKTPRGRFWAGVCGLCAQPAWLYTTVSHGQYAISALCLLYGLGWVRTILNNRDARVTLNQFVTEQERADAEKNA
jgi:hypothetical protein